MKCHLGTVSVRLSPTKKESHADIRPSPKKMEPPTNAGHFPKKVNLSGNDGCSLKKVEMSGNDRRSPKKVEMSGNDRHSPKKVEMSGKNRHSPKKVELSGNDRHSPKKVEMSVNVRFSPKKMESPVETQVKDLWTSDYEETPLVGHLTEQRTSCIDFNSFSEGYVDNMQECKLTQGKENENGTPLHDVRRTLYLEDSEIQGDSGYASTQNSHLMESSDDALFAVPLDDKPNRFCAQSRELISNLPIVQFEDVVCSTLKKTSRRNTKLDWDFVDHVISHTDFGLRNVIGRKMGLDRVDILGELFRRDFKHLVGQILRNLSDMDLINVAGVSRTWNKILTADKWAFPIYLTTLDTVLAKDAKFTPDSATRTCALHRAALTSVQMAASPNSKSTKKSTRYCQTGGAGVPHSRHAEFCEVAKSLKNDESLKACPHCWSPAKIDSYMHRATCTRASCGFDFCTGCLCTYHFSKDCASNKSQTPGFRLGPLPGSRKSKQNLRRL